jgi:hypothetical protein
LGDLVQDQRKKNPRDRHFGQKDSNFRIVVCRACGKGSIWKWLFWLDKYNYFLVLADPILPKPPHALSDMPEDMQADYEEARFVVNYSTRAAAALLRLSLKKLCRHLGAPGNHLETDIRYLAKRPEFGRWLMKTADTLMITGNNAIRPGEINQDDIDNNCSGLFDFINLIINFGITQPKQWDVMHKSLPEKPERMLTKNINDETGAPTS